MTQSPEILMLAGAAIGAAVATFFWLPYLTRSQRNAAELRGRASAVAFRLVEADVKVERLTQSAAQEWRRAQKYERAIEALHAAAAQNTMSGARKVIAEGLENARTAGETTERQGE